MKSFVYAGLPYRVIFGAGTVVQLNVEVKALELQRVLVLTTPQQSQLGQTLDNQLGDLSAGVFSEATMHTPVKVTEKALSVFRSVGADGVVAIGGGSTVGLSKAIALHTDAPQIVLPTTYAGSEMTSIIGQTEDGRKTTQNTLKVLPETVIYDIDHTLGLPPVMSVTSGLNAVAHAVEALYAQNANPVLSLMAEDGVAALMRALPKITESPTDSLARRDALYGAWLCAMCLGSSDVALHHKLCHALAGSFNLPHAETHTIVLPHALAYNAPAVSAAMAQLRRATGSETPAAAFFDVAKSSGAPTALKDIGMPEDGIERAVEITLKNPYWNPRPFEEDAIREIIHAAWEGLRPSV
ncbi:MAG: maleylacetate reductase [Pseudomonadota bacterium]